MDHATRMEFCTDQIRNFHAETAKIVDEISNQLNKLIRLETAFNASLEMACDHLDDLNDVMDPNTNSDLVAEGKVVLQNAAKVIFKMDESSVFREAALVAIQTKLSN